MDAIEKLLDAMDKYADAKRISDEFYEARGYYRTEYVDDASLARREVGDAVAAAIAEGARGEINADKGIFG